MKKDKNKHRIIKVVDERYNLPKKHGGGIIKIEAWQATDNTVVKYNIAYINHRLYQGDNGRVIGYDNAHDVHHKHFFGSILPVNDFINYEDIVNRFENEIKAYIK